MSNRRNATEADMTIGSLVFKGNGNTLYRVSWISGDGAYAVTKATTVKDGIGSRCPLAQFTVAN